LARQPQKIKVVSYIRIDNRLVNMDDLNELQKQYVATILKQRYMNALFRGKAVFDLPHDMPAAEDIFPELRKAPTPI